MFIPNSTQLKEWDQFTIQQQGIRSIELMERTANACMRWIESKQFLQKKFLIFCGKGNNGGDGLAIARLLLYAGSKVKIYISETGHAGSPDFQENLQRLHAVTKEIHFIQDERQLNAIQSEEIIIDALFGSGLNKPIVGTTKSIIDWINNQSSSVISIDLPSGLYIDKSSKGNPVVKADFTLTFQTTKLALLIQENAQFIGEVTVLDIGLDQAYTDSKKFEHLFVQSSLIKQIYEPRNRFAHKGNFGHAGIFAGSFGKMGAAVLCAKACLHSGVGLLTSFIPRCGYVVMQTAVPEAMVIADENEESLAQLPGDMDKYEVIGVGPGIGTSNETITLISYLLRRVHKPIVADADALNIIAKNQQWLKQLPAGTIITPHPKEFDRLFGEQANDFERLECAHTKAKEFNIVIVLKGHHTSICTPGGLVYFNSTGNAGMAKGGSGDVLTGILTAMVAQKYDSVEAAIFGVYLHGLAGDLAAKDLSMESMVAGDIINYLGEVFKQLAD